MIPHVGVSAAYRCRGVSCWVIIPVKPPGEGKRRLAEVLDADQRDELVRAMLGHVVAKVSAARGVDHLCLLGHSRHGQAAAIRLMADPDRGLNSALTHAMVEAAAAGASRVVFIAADLPRITSNDVEALTGVAGGLLAIAPDRHGTGTNALSLPIPSAKRFGFAYGPDSFIAHDAEACRLGLDMQVIVSPGLEHDVDLPEDLGYVR